MYICHQFILSLTQDWSSNTARVITQVLVLPSLMPVFIACFTIGRFDEAISSFLPVAMLTLSASRLVNHRHSPADVTAGALLGIVGASLYFARLVGEAGEYTRGEGPSLGSVHVVAPPRNI